MRKAVLLCLLLLVLGAAPSATGEADLPLLVGTVGPGFTIDLADAQGQHVAILTEGKYQLLIHDLADVHNFVLGSQSTGALIASTEVPFVGDMTFTIDLVPGAYAYACAPHFNVMNGRFVVVRAAPPPDTTKTLTAKVTSKAVSLSATKATAGNYKLTVADRSKARNFHLVGPGVNRRTSKAFTGSVTWRLSLETGTYRFGSDPRLSGRLVVRDG